MSGTSTFYVPFSGRNLLQGDVVLAPTSVLWSPEAKGIVVGPPPTQPRLGKNVLATAWRATSKTPGLVYESRYSLAIVVSHDCAMEKEWNEMVRHLLVSGVPRSEAEEVASANPDLDALLMVAPLLTHHEIPPNIAGMRDRVGWFEMPPIPDMPSDTLYADLGRISVIDYRTIRLNPLVSLAPISAGALRFKLVEQFAYRQLTNVRELDNAIGKKLVSACKIETSKKKSNSVLTLHFEDGSTCELEVRTLLAPIDAPERTAGSRPRVLNLDGPSQASFSRSLATRLVDLSLRQVWTVITSLIQRQ